MTTAHSTLHRTFDCPWCGAINQVDVAQIGSHWACPECKKETKLTTSNTSDRPPTAPPPDAPHLSGDRTFDCPWCGAISSVPSSHLGERFSCPECRRETKLTATNARRAPVTAPPPDAPPAEPPPARGAWIAIAVVGALAAIGLWMALSGGGSSTETEKVEGTIANSEMPPPTINPNARGSTGAPPMPTPPPREGTDASAMTDAPMPGQPMPGQPMPGQPMPEPPMPGQQVPGPDQPAPEESRPPTAKGAEPAPGAPPMPTPPPREGAEPMPPEPAAPAAASDKAERIEKARLEVAAATQASVQKTQARAAALEALDAWRQGSAEHRAASADRKALAEVKAEGKRLLDEKEIVDPSAPTPTGVRAFNAAIAKFAEASPERVRALEAVLARMKADPATAAEVADRSWNEVNFFGPGFSRTLAASEAAREQELAALLPKDLARALVDADAQALDAKKDLDAAEARLAEVLAEK